MSFKLKSVAALSTVLAASLVANQASAYNYGTHSRIAEMAVRSMTIQKDGLSAPTPEDAALFQQYLQELSHAPNRLRKLRTGLPSKLPQANLIPFLAADESYPFGERPENCRVRPQDNLDNLSQFRIEDLHYIPNRTADPCGLRLVTELSEAELEGVPAEERVLEKVMGFHAGSVDDHLNDVVLWFRPTNAWYWGLIKEGASLIVEYGLGTLALPFVCAYEAIFGDGCDLDDSYELARKYNPVDYIEGWIPGIGDIRSDMFTGLWHFLHVDAGVNRFNNQRGMWYVGAGPSYPGAMDIAILASSDASGLSLNAYASEGDDHYGDYDKISREIPAWQAHTIGHLEWSPVDNLARYGWDRFVEHGHSNAEGLAWPLHAIGDVAEPHHVVGTTSWGHRPYEEIIDHDEAAFFPDGAARATQLRQIVVEGFRWWKQFRAGENMQQLVEDLAAQTRKKVKDADDWAYQDGPSVRWQVDNAGGEEVYDRKDDEMRALLVDGAAVTLAVLTVASTKVPDAPRGDIECPAGTSYAPGLGCVPGPPPIRPQPIDLGEAGIALVATDDAGGVCTPDVTLDGATLALTGARFDVTAPTQNDSCPGMFWVEIRNPRQVFTRGALSLGAAIDISPVNEQTCERSFALHAAHQGASGMVEDAVVSGTGAFASCSPDQPLCFLQCSGLPQRSFGPNALPSEVAVRFGTPVRANTVVAITTPRPIEPPH